MTPRKPKPAAVVEVAAVTSRQFGMLERVDVCSLPGDGLRIKGPGEHRSAAGLEAHGLARVVIAATSHDLISHRLRQLTRKLHEHGADVDGGFLGGADGYGADFENEVFTMRKFDWNADCSCEREPCLEWCTVPINFRCGPFFVRWYKWIGRGMEVTGPAMTDAEIAAMFDLCEASL